MALKKRSVTMTTSAGGAATATVGLGAKYGIVKAIRWDSGADNSSDLTITSTVGGLAHAIYTRTGVDASAAGGIINYVSPVEADVFDSAGEVMTANGDASTGVVAQSPVSLTIANGGNAETHYVDLFVEV